jgi:hypothetical protein
MATFGDQALDRELTEAKKLWCRKKKFHRQLRYLAAHPQLGNLFNQYEWGCIWSGSFLA